MKLAEALAHLTENCPGLFPLGDDEGLAEVESMIRSHRMDLRAMEIVAHSLRAKERWARENWKNTRECLNPEVLKRITSGGNNE